MDQALFAVVMEAYLHGVSTRKVDDLVRALGTDSVSQKERYPVSAPISTTKSVPSGTAAWPGKPFPMSFSMPPTARPRVDRRVVSQAIVVATGVAGDGHREVLGFAVGDSEDGAFWTAFLRSLKAGGEVGW